MSQVQAAVPHRFEQRESVREPPIAFGGLYERILLGLSVDGLALLGDDGHGAEERLSARRTQQVPPRNLGRLVRLSSRGSSWHVGNQERDQCLALLQSAEG